MSGNVHPLEKDAMKDSILREMREAEAKAWDAMSRYKFWMFGYWAARWVAMNRLLNTGRQTNPFRSLVDLARQRTRTQEA